MQGQGWRQQRTSSLIFSYWAVKICDVSVWRDDGEKASAASSTTQHTDESCLLMLDSSYGTVASLEGTTVPYRTKAHKEKRNPSVCVSSSISIFVHRSILFHETSSSKRETSFRAPRGSVLHVEQKYGKATRNRTDTRTVGLTQVESSNPKDRRRTKYWFKVNQEW